MQVQDNDAVGGASSPEQEQSLKEHPMATKLSDKSKLIVAKSALSVIASMVDPDECSDAAEEAGLDENEFIAMAYENAIYAAQHALHQMKD